MLKFKITKHEALIIALVISKFFYFSVAQFGSLNITLSDILSFVMLVYISPNISRIGGINYSIFLISLLLMFTSILGSALNNTSIVETILMFVKRWLSLILIPMYFTVFSHKIRTRLVMKSIYLIVLMYTIIHVADLVASMNTDRYNTVFNPNVLGTIMSILLVYTMSVKNVIGSKKRILLMLLFIFYILVVSSRGALMSLVPVLILMFFSLKKRYSLANISKAISVVVAIIFAAPTLISLLISYFPYSITRYVNTINNSIFQDRSLVSRLTTQSRLIYQITAEPIVFLFGVGFGNGNILNFMNKKGFFISTGDNMYVNILAWSGMIGMILFIFLLLTIYKYIKSEENDDLRKPIYLVFIYVCLSGFALDTLTEPTIGTIFFILFGMFLIDKTGRLTIEK